MKIISITFPGGRDRVFTLSYDDAVDTDADLIKILEKYNVKCTFNINGGMFNSEDAVRPPENSHFRLPRSRIREVYDHPLCEVATHGFVHPRYETLTADRALADILADRRELESIFERPIRGHAYPYGTYTAETIEVLRLAGIAYARTSKETHDLKLPTNWLRWDATCHHSVYDMPELIDRFLNEEVPADEDGRLFYIWGHSCEFREDKNWYVIEDILEKVSGKDEVWYATNIDIYEYINAFRSLIYSADKDVVYNPSGQTVWIKVYDGSDVRKTEVAPLETVRIN